MRDAMGPNSGHDCGDVNCRGTADLRRPSQGERVALLTQLSAYYPITMGEMLHGAVKGGEACIHLLLSIFKRDWPSQPSRQGELNYELPPLVCGKGR